MPKRIIAVDDEPDVLLIVRSALEGEGFQVRSFGSGAECIEAAKEDPPDLFVLDVMMPGMSGFDIVHALKAHGPTSTLPIIMVTGLSERQKIKEALVSGVVYYITKPFEFDDLIAKVNQALADSQGQ